MDSITTKVSRRPRGWKIAMLSTGVAAALLLTVIPGAAAANAQNAPAQTSAAAQVKPAPVKPGPAKPGTVSRNFALTVTVSGNTNMRACASTSCAIVGTASPSHALTSCCYVNGQVISGVQWWDIVYNASTGRAGFITESLLNTTAQSDLC